jgi:hypothetical protein
MHASYGRMPEKRRELLLGLFIVMHVKFIDLALERSNFYPQNPSVSVQFDLHTGGARKMWNIVHSIMPYISLGQTRSSFILPLSIYGLSIASYSKRRELERTKPYMIVFIECK